MKKLFLIIGLTLPLLAQDTYDAPEEVDREITKQEQRENRTAGMINTLQDWDFRKYEAAHSRAHAKMDNNPQRYRRAQMVRQHRTKQWIKNILIGGVAYYVGYKVAQDEMKKGHKGKKPMTWAREDKK
tara:strand:- start:147 stop:530 length:384 start_codon:yes stop_codon:yes gene_type:complete